MLQKYQLSFRLAAYFLATVADLCVAWFQIFMYIHQPSLVDGRPFIAGFRVACCCGFPLVTGSRLSQQPSNGDMLQLQSQVPAATLSFGLPTRSSRKSRC